MRKLVALKQVLYPAFMGFFSLYCSIQLQANTKPIPEIHAEAIPKAERMPLNVTGMDATVSLGSSFQLIHVSTFIENIDNACMSALEKSIIRLDDPVACGYAGNGMPNDSIGICCDDVGETIMVQVTVSDLCGDTIVFMASLIVQDESPPVIMRCVSNITLSCSYPVDINDMSELGIMEINTGTLTEFTVDDPLFAGDEMDDLAYNGMVMDVCPESLTIEEVIDDQRVCHTGQILRTFIVTDGSGNSTSCTQTITFENPNLFSEMDISWPEHVEYNSCMNAGISPDSTGRPVFNLTDNCSQPAASYSDWIFDMPNSGCVMVERKWKVIDWCTFDHTLPPGSERPGEWFYVQYIKVVNTEAPVFENQPDTLELCITGPGCLQEFTISIEAIDDCTDPEDIKYTYSLDLNNDGSIDDTGIGFSVDKELERGEHKIIWNAKDRCGNTGILEQIIIVKDCKAPTPICHLGLAVSVTPMGMVEVWAADFNNKSYDQCTPQQDLVFSFSSDVNDQVKIFDCDDVDDPVVIEMWVTDLDGNQSFCITTLDVQDNPEVCSDEEDMPRAAMISGHVITALNTPIKDVQVNLEGPEMDDYRMTDQEGKYAFEDLFTRYGYELIPIKDDFPLNGVSTLDLLMIQQHILGVRPFENPFSLIAADINNSGSVTTTDIIQLRKMILGLYDAFPENNSWRFVHSKYGIIDNESPWPFLEGLFVPDLVEDVMDGDFIGIKIGDVNQSVEEELNKRSIETRSNEVLAIGLKDKQLASGEVIEVPFIIKSRADLVALQWTVSLDGEKLTFLDWKAEGINLKTEELAILEGEGQHITMAWSHLNPVHLASGTAVITLILKSHENILLSDHLQLGSTITKAMAYNQNFERMEIEPEWTKVQSFDFAVHQNMPNPFHNQTVINFDLPEEAFAEIVIHDATGKQIYRNRSQYPSGKNQLSITDQELGKVSGVLYYTVQSGVHTATKKMIYLK